MFPWWRWELGWKYMGISSSLAITWYITLGKKPFTSLSLSFFLCKMKNIWLNAEWSLGHFQRPTILTREATNNADKCHDLAVSREKKPGYLKSMTLFVHKQKMLKHKDIVLPSEHVMEPYKILPGKSPGPLIFKPLMTTIQATIFLEVRVLSCVKVNESPWEVAISWNALVGEAQRARVPWQRRWSCMHGNAKSNREEIPSSHHCTYPK